MIYSNDRIRDRETNDRLRGRDPNDDDDDDRCQPQRDYDDVLEKKYMFHLLNRIDVIL